MTSRAYAIIGGSKGMGKALADLLIARGDKVVIGARDEHRLETVASELGPLASWRVIDSSKPRSVSAFFQRGPMLDGLFTPGASYTTVSFRDGTLEEARATFEGKFWNQYCLVHHALPFLSERAGVVLVSGTASVRPLGSPVYAACNAAVEGLARGLARELSPIRVNCLSPGLIDSDLWKERTPEARLSAHASWANVTLTKRPGSVAEAAQAAAFLLDNAYLTGSTIYCDGGFTLR